MGNIPDLIYLGPEGTYTEAAAQSFMESLGIGVFNRNIKKSIISVIKSIDNSNNSIGIVPIENSIEGIVRETIDNLIRTASNVVITGEIIIPVSHCLISKNDNAGEINKIISMPQALAQCRNFLETNYPDVEKIPAKSTSEAVRQLSELPGNYAAIGSSRAAEIYRFNILFSGINDEKDNVTRFVSLGSSIPSPTGKDKTSIAVSITNKPGALVDILLAFKENNINLSYIESRPSRKTLGDYTFFIDFEGHIKDESIQQAIEKIMPFVKFYRFLGSYPGGKLLAVVK